MRSENWGGLASMAGSLVALAAGDVEGVMSTAAFVLSELCFLRKGHTSAGYSLGCAGISLGDGLLCLSQATAGNPALRATMLVLTVIWGLGALRYPLERGAAAWRRGGTWFALAVACIQPTVGCAALALRLPALLTAALAGEHVNATLLVCTLLWGLADILLGRVQSVGGRLLRLLALLPRPER